MLLILLVFSLSLASTAQEVDEDDWIDPHDMLHYDATTKTMRKPAEIEELKKEIRLISQQPTCNPVFKRFLTRLRKDLQRLGLPSDPFDVFYDAKIRVSTNTMAEIQSLLDGEDSLRTGALDNAISQILVDLKPHDYETWKWRFEDTFDVELDTLLKMGLLVLIIVAIVCTQLWSRVSWFMQLSRLFYASFFISIIWNWLYLYKIAFAEHQSNMAKMDGVYEKCTGVKKIDWSDSLKEWFRSSWTLQGDPCKKYYELLLVNPILLVPPTKAFAVTITTMITEPLKHIGQGISEFLVALLKDLPFTLQIPVLFTIVLAIVVCMYGGVQAAFQHGIAAPFRRPRGDPPPPQLEQPQPRVQEVLAGDNLAGGDAPLQAPMHQAVEDRLHGNQVRQRQPDPTVESLGRAEPPHGGDETDAEQQEADPNLSAESNSENFHEIEGESAIGVAAETTISKTKATESDSLPSKKRPLIGNELLSPNKVVKDSAATQPAGRQQSSANVQDLYSVEDSTSYVSLPPVETVGVPVQETSAASSVNSGN
uniref:Chloride channel CLIC-like protein 1 n=1 Tax=Gasterosteus aculeatus aculeatus TaxID=481459 RepID=G3P5W2_GASAC